MELLCSDKTLSEYIASKWDAGWQASYTALLALTQMTNIVGDVTALTKAQLFSTNFWCGSH